MNESYAEWLIEKKPSPFDNLIRTGAYALTLILFAAGLFFWIILLIPAVISAVCCYLFLPRLNVEYEYLYLNRSLSVDVIYSKEKRRNVAEFELDKMELFAREGASVLENYRDKALKVRDFSSRDPGAGRFILVIREGEELQKIILEPDQKITDAIKHLYPSKVFFK